MQINSPQTSFISRFLGFLVKLEFHKLTETTRPVISFEFITQCCSLKTNTYISRSQHNGGLTENAIMVNLRMNHSPALTMTVIPSCSSWELHIRLAIFFGSGQAPSPISTEQDVTAFSAMELVGLLTRRSALMPAPLDIHASAHVLIRTDTCSNISVRFKGGLLYLVHISIASIFDLHRVCVECFFCRQDNKSLK